jgi:plastocyanin
MRLRRLLLPLTVVFSLAATGPAMAVDWTMDVVDYDFVPASRQIAVGDSVTWTFSQGDHTTTAVDGQAEQWDSGLRPPGTTFRREFTKPGRYQFVCLPHEGFGMRGVIQVGEDAVARTFRNLRQHRSGRRLRISFQLREPARMRFRLRGPSGKTVKRARLLPGLRSVRLGLLKPGTYRGVLTLTDDFDKRAVGRTYTVVR